MALPYWHHVHMRNIAIPVAEAMEKHQEVHQAVCNVMLNPNAAPPEPPMEYRCAQDTVLPALRSFGDDLRTDVAVGREVARAQIQQQEYRHTMAKLGKFGVTPPEQRMYICRCPPPYNVVPGRKTPKQLEQYFQHRAVVGDLSQKHFDSMPPIKLADDCKKVGYWSIVVPKMNMKEMERTARALQLIAKQQALVSVFIDSPDVSVRFDLRKRQKGMLRMQAEVRPPSMPRDAIPWTTQDPDSLIIDHKQYKEALSLQEIHDQIKNFRVTMMRSVACSGLRIHVKPSRNDLLMSYNSKDDELRARGLLCEMIGWEEYKKYLKRGFIVVQGASGMLYKISGGHSMIYVYQRKETGDWYYRESICLQFKDHNLPFTDGVIMRKLFVESDEFGMRKMANVRQNIWPDSLQDMAREQRRMERVG